jgi:hypothetical protein
MPTAGEEREVSNTTDSEKVCHAIFVVPEDAHSFRAKVKDQFSRPGG